MIRIVWKVLRLIAVAALVVAWAVTLRPQALGGPAVFVAVRGSSMLPTYEHGDLLVVHAAAHYRVGDAAAYRVPAGQIGEGKIVIHRITGGDGVNGFTLQGDNNSAPDPWSPRQADMVGIATFLVPSAGSSIALVRQPVILAGLAAALMVTVILSRPPRRGRGKSDPPETSRA